MYMGCQHFGNVNNFDKETQFVYFQLLKKYNSTCIYDILKDY